MTTVEIREKVSDYLAHADDRIVKMVYAMLKEYEKTPAQKSVMSDGQYEEMERRFKNYKSGKSKGFTIEEVRQYVKSNMRK